MVNITRKREANEKSIAALNTKLEGVIKPEIGPDDAARCPTFLRSIGPSIDPISKVN